jgi:hypothetical protein
MQHSIWQKGEISIASSLKAQASLPPQTPTYLWYKKTKPKTKKASIDEKALP